MREQPIRASVDAVSASESLDVNDLHGAFAEERRRLALDVLTDGSPPLDARTLARRVAARETDSSTESVPSKRVERVHVALYHTHLPKLADFGLVDYDAEEAVVTDYDDALDSMSF